MTAYIVIIDTLLRSQYQAAQAGTVLSYIVTKKLTHRVKPNIFKMYINY